MVSSGPILTVKVCVRADGHQIAKSAAFWVRRMAPPRGVRRSRQLPLRSDLRADRDDDVRDAIRVCACWLIQD
jgi:hypothetical protein